MKVAEALLLRSDIQKRIDALKARIAATAMVQEGSAPSEDPADLLARAHGAIHEFAVVVERINRTNARATLADGRTITAALARRDALRLQHSMLTSSIAACQKEVDRYSTREIKWVSLLPVSKLRAQADDIGKSLRDLNTALQQANWSIDLVD